ncbi:PucR family transcriptional regulator [Amycolatopsis nigrescens]|uniref:PucR family transcriptional regulator n=1 Tax=Amycolatopsis nigrescens TaxID=381445 RepID=UPI000374F972|nr:helix-turn-helix domain-containing protein [Amycolatopsis nigrescens]
MTGHKATVELGLRGVPFHALLAGRMPELSRLVLSRLHEEIPAYRQLPVEELRGDISSITADTLRAFSRSLREDRPLSAAELEQITASAARRAEEGFPLAAVLTAYQLGTRITLAEITADAGPEDVADVRAVTDRVLAFLQDVVGAVTTGYLDELQIKFGQEHNARGALLSALLEGGQAEAGARSAGIELSPAYLVLSLAVGAHPDEVVPGVDAAIAVRRKLRRLLAEFDHFGRGSVLASLDGAGGVLLLPAGGEDWADWSGLLRRAARAAGAEVTAAGQVAGPAELPEAAERTAEVLEVVSWFGLAPGLYRLEDVLVEYQLTRPGAARDRLAALLDPLADRPELLETLHTYLADELNRRRTAARLHVHPNTVDYRLRRIRELTGIDPGHPAGLPRITAAVAARRAGVGPERRTR